MTEDAAFKSQFSRRHLLAGFVLLGISAFAQAMATVQGADRLQFEVASVRQNKSNDDGFMNVDPTLWDSAVSTGGLYQARNIKLIQYIAFAYSLTQIQLASVVSQAPWVAEDRFDIEVRAVGDPTKAQYRIMMQSLLADRFRMVVHYETRQVSIYALVLAKPSKLGPQLRLHHEDDPVCSASATDTGRQADDVDADGIPTTCLASLILKPSAPGRMRLGGRNVSMASFAAVETGVGEVDRPMVDETGLKKNVDYTLEWAKARGNMGAGARVDADESAPTFKEALQDQLGIKMVSKKGPVDIFVLDHIEHPSPN